ncbi:methyl-accepting chemotaxis protein [Vibrio sp. JC009]|uniref:methyl-accepting chemotaxis protein n=1 Tax=Vibrio sp. JC009 TaxID=2912314 RepID=UPI0023B0CA33|nr:methyl-accepting chemotaxis protein [Vibrio sp. JC009]WED22605.1 methyl-accepting chemotaxis protein [Vibrio sp. JC009]
MNKLLNFKGRIVSVSIVLLALSMAVLSYLSYSQMSALATKNVDAYSILRVSSNADKIHGFIDNIRTDITGTAGAFSGFDSSDQEGNMDMLKHISLMSEASAIVVGYEDGLAYNSNKGKYGADYDPRVRGWYKSAKAKGETVITDIYTGKSTGTLMISVASPFYKDRALAGVLLADVELTALVPMVQKTVFDGAIAALYDDTGLTIASTGEVDVPGESRLSDFPELVALEKTMLAQDVGMFEFSLLGMDKVAYFERLELDKETSWHLLVALDKAKVYSVLSESRTTSLLTTVALVAISALLIFIALSYMYKPLLALKQTVNDLSHGNGDLTRRLPVTSNDDLGQISGDINTFISNLQEMMLKISDASTQINGSIAGLQGLTEANHKTLSQHKAETEQVVAALDEMSATSNDVAHNTAEAVQFTGATNNKANESKLVVSGATDTVAQLVERVGAASQQVNQMGGEITEITQVLKVIGDIAEQTNLLALNAAIEAARAGEQGRGFAVVADEVRALASRTQDSTSEIQNTINRLTSSSQNVIDAMDETRTSCEEASSQTNLVVTDLDSISESVDQINNLNVQIATAAEQQNSVSEEITRNMAAISEMIERISTASDDVNNEAANLAGANTELTEIVGQFKLQ